MRHALKYCSMFSKLCIHVLGSGLSRAKQGPGCSYPSQKHFKQRLVWCCGVRAKRTRAVCSIN